jgi:hypothetical protein
MINYALCQATVPWGISGPGIGVMSCPECAFSGRTRPCVPPVWFPPNWFPRVKGRELWFPPVGIFPRGFPPGRFRKAASSAASRRQNVLQMSWTWHVPAKGSVRQASQHRGVPGSRRGRYGHSGRYGSGHSFRRASGAIRRKPKPRSGQLAPAEAAFSRHFVRDSSALSE